MKLNTRQHQIGNAHAQQVPVPTACINEKSQKTQKKRDKNPILLANYKQLNFF